MKIIKRIWKTRLVVGLGVLTLSLCSLRAALDAQVVGGAISGTVTDISGAVVAGAQLTIRSKETNATRTTITNGTGFYSVPDLDPGTYDLTSSAKGFSTVEVSSIVLTIGARLDVSVKMLVGQATQTVTVETGTAGVDLQTSAISSVVSASTLVELPLNGRSWIDLANLQPGVAPTMQLANGASGKGSRGVGEQVAISGNRPDQNNYRLDGITINDFANGSPGGMTGGTMGVDAIAEFSVLTTNYSAEYGRASGGIFNALTRSGSNTIHGSAYEFVRNSVLDARNYFDGPVIPSFRRNQFGASAGGPIKKDKTFIFGDYEGFRQSKGQTYSDTVPSAAARAGNLSTGTVTVNPGVAAILQAFYPLPNGPLNSSGDTGSYRFPYQVVINEDFVTAKGDHNFSQKDRFSGIYLWDKSFTSSPDPLNTRLVSSLAGRQLATMQESHTFTGALLNAFKLGLSRTVGNMANSSTPINPNASNLAFGSDPQRTAAQIKVPGLTTFQGGLGSQTNFVFYYDSLQLDDDVYWTHGVHALKVGFSYEGIQDIMSGASNADGLASFGSLPLFLQGSPKSYLAGVAVPSNTRRIHMAIYGAYVQDDIRVLKNLTANVGLRYETATVPTEKNGLLSTIQSFTSTAPPHLGSPYFNNPTHVDFEPRIGLVWDPFGSGKTSVRAGFGIYDMLILPAQIQQNALFSYPYYPVYSSSSLPAGSFPQSVYADVSANTSTFPYRYGYIQQTPGRSYDMQWNLNIQRDLPMNTTVTVGYVASRGIHAPYQDADMNIVLPNLTSQGYLWPSPAGSGTRLNTAFSDISSTQWIGQSAYDALQVGVVKHLTRSFQMQGSYTWGKVFDESSGSIAADQFANSLSSSPPWWAPKTGRGLADFNVTQNFLVNTTWFIPAPETAKGFVGGITKGWEMGGIFKLDSGLPFTVNIAGDPLGENSTDPYDYPNRLTTSGCHTLTNPGQLNYVNAKCLAFPNNPLLLGNLPRNSLIGPGLANLDLSLFKNNKFGDRFSSQFRLEVFNILNRANFAPPIDNSSAFSSTGAPIANLGAIDQTISDSRQIQFGFKLLW